MDRIVQERRRVLFGREGPQRLGDALAGINAVHQRFSLPAAKERLSAEIRALINDPQTGPWLSDFAADLLLNHGQGPAPYAPKVYEAMNRLLQEFRDLREIQRRYGYFQYPLGARLNKVVHAICDAHGIVTPYKRRIARQAVSANREAP